MSPAITLRRAEIHLPIEASGGASTMNPRDPIVRPAAVDVAQTEPSRRCRVARKCASSTQFRGEIELLLHGRLRAVTLIALVPSALFLLRNLTTGRPSPNGPIDLWLHAGST